MPPGGRAAALRAGGPGAAAARVSAESGATAGRPEERGERAGEGGGPAEAAAELEAQPAEQPASHDPAGRIPGRDFIIDQQCKVVRIKKENASEHLACGVYFFIFFFICQ